MSGSLAATLAPGNPASPAATAAQGAAQARTTPGIANDFNTFLTLLTTQLRNQSPTDPLDTNQMTSQLVQFASVEQQIAMNQNLTAMIGLQQNSALSAAAGLVGRRVEMETDRLALQGGVATLRLPAAGSALAARVTIADSTGRIVRQQDVPLASGPREWNWDGRDLAGNRMTDGAYRVAVAGVGSDGQTTTTAPAFTVIGTATAATRSGGAVNLNLGGLAVPYSQLRAVAT